MPPVRPSFSDSFAYAVAALAGQGGWLADPDATNGLLVTAPGSVQPDPAGDAACLHPILVTPWDPWEIIAVLQLPAATDFAGYSLVFATLNERNELKRISVTINPFSNPTTFSITDGNLAADVQYTLNVPFTIRMAWDGTAMHYEVNGVEQLNTTYPPSLYYGPFALLMGSGYGIWRATLHSVIARNI